MNTSQLESNLHIFRDVTVPDRFLRTRSFTQGLSLLAVLLFFFFSLIVFQELGRIGNKKSKIKRNTLRLLLGNLVFSVITCAWNASLTMLDDVDPMFCSYYGRLGGILYVGSNFFIYLLLLKRTEACQNNMQLSRAGKIAYAVIIVLVKLGTATVPLVAVATVILFEGRLYFSEGLCVEYVDETICWTILFLDTTLSMGYLLLFILPVLDHMGTSSSSVAPNQQNISKSTIETAPARRSTTIKATAKRNLVISSVAIGSTFMYVGGVSLVADITSGGDTDISLVPYLHLLNWQHYASVFDMCINSICVMIMFKGLWTTPGIETMGRKGTAIRRTLLPSVGTAKRDLPDVRKSYGCEPLFPDESDVSQL